MNVEVEIKVKIENLEGIKKRVSEIGKLIKSIKQIDEYYVPLHRDFFAQKVRTEWLRIRTNPDKTVFEYDLSVNKDKNGKQEYAKEYETGISEPDEFRKILDFLNFRKVITVEKQREYWDCGNIEVALDKIKDLGDFIEAEAKGDFKTSKEAEEACLNMLYKLGIKDAKEKQINKGYPELLLDKNGK